MDRSFRYRLTESRVAIGPETFDLETIADLDAEVDRLCASIADNVDPAIEAEALDLAPYFGVLWPSARALGEWLLERRAEIAGASVLEVGCGLGLPALAAARAGARVLASDFHPHVPELLRRNALRNRVTCEYRHADWRDEGLFLGEFDHVVGSDVFYDKEHVGALTPRLARHMAPGGRIVLADPGRAWFLRAVEELVRLGFEAHEERRALTPSATDDAIRSPERREIRIVTFRRGSG